MAKNANLSHVTEDSTGILEESYSIITKTLVSKTFGGLDKELKKLWLKLDTVQQ